MGEPVLALGLAPHQKADLIASLQSLSTASATSGRHDETSLVVGLWGLTFGPGADSTTLFFTSGPSGEAHGLLGLLRPK